jgi:MYXO-CTERM domain-containing protein
VPKAGVACTTKDDCASGFCVDGVCCDGPCLGQCEACDIPGLEGKCSGVSGQPHGTTRTKCSDGGTDVCRALACDGTKDRTKCVGFANGPDKECIPATCKDGAATAAGFCDGSGACKTGSTSTCGNFACDTTTCKTSCKTDADCTTGFTCDTSSGKCVPPKPTCSADGLSTISPDKSIAPKSCGPYRCNGSTGDCYLTCATSDQCAPGNTCDGTNCVAAAPPTDGGDTGSSGGCTVDGHDTTPGFGLGAVLVGALAFVSRRKRRG